LIISIPGKSSTVPAPIKVSIDVPKLDSEIDLIDLLIYGQLVDQDLKVSFRIFQLEK
jgi:hypothetical protein